MTTILHAPDIECDACAASIQRVLARTPGVGEVTVNVEAKTVTVAHEAAVETVKAALEGAGFPVE